MRLMNFPSNGLSDLSEHSIAGKGVLEPVGSNLQGIFADRLINARVGAFRSEIPSSCGLRSDEMGRGSSLEHPEYSDTIISAKTLSELMTAAETILTQESPKMLQHLTIPETRRMIFVGDTACCRMSCGYSSNMGSRRGRTAEGQTQAGDVSAYISTDGFLS